MRSQCRANSRVHNWLSYPPIPFPACCGEFPLVILRNTMYRAALRAVAAISSNRLHNTAGHLIAIRFEQRRHRAYKSRPTHLPAWGEGAAHYWKSNILPCFLQLTRQREIGKGDRQREICGATVGLRDVCAAMMLIACILMMSLHLPACRQSALQYPPTT
jgi:hypothetical protein